MDRYEKAIVALSDGRAHVHVRAALASLTTSLFHVYNHLLERIGLLLDLPSADWWQKKARVLIDV